MRIGMATTDGVYVNEHFGNAKYWDIYELDEESEFAATSPILETNSASQSSSALSISSNSLGS